jgi:hypothetical protein
MAIISNADVEYLNDMKIYDIKNFSWHACEEVHTLNILQNGVLNSFSKKDKNIKIKPEGRFGFF